MSTEPLTKEWFEEGLRRGSVVRLVLTAPCHKNRGARVKFWQDGVVEARCATCNAFMLSFSIIAEDRMQFAQQIRCADVQCMHTADEHFTLLTPMCHVGAGLLLAYAHGAVRARCMRCRKQPWPPLRVRAAAEIEPTTTITPIAPPTIKPAT